MNSKLIKNITIIDPIYDAPLENMAILIKKRKIIAIDKSSCIDIDDGCEIIDGEENFIKRFKKSYNNLGTLSLFSNI